MSKINNYEGWKDAVFEERKHIAHCISYLNEEGHKRLEVFDYLCSMSIFADSAKELLENIIEPESKTEPLLKSQHALPVIGRLKIIAEAENFKK